MDLTLAEILGLLAKYGPVQVPTLITMVLLYLTRRDLKEEQERSRKEREESQRKWEQLAEKATNTMATLVSVLNPRGK